MHEVLTVQEMLLYTADLKRPLKEPSEAKRKAVKGMLTALGLEQCQDTTIGNALNRGISGGQVCGTSDRVAAQILVDARYMTWASN